MWLQRSAVDCKYELVNRDSDIPVRDTETVLFVVTYSYIPGIIRIYLFQASVDAHDEQQKTISRRCVWRVSEISKIIAAATTYTSRCCCSGDQRPNG